jgi:hypothetical protein
LAAPAFSNFDGADSPLVIARADPNGLGAYSFSTLIFDVPQSASPADDEYRASGAPPQNDDKDDNGASSPQSTVPLQPFAISAAVSSPGGATPATYSSISMTVDFGASQTLDDFGASFTGAGGGGGGGPVAPFIIPVPVVRPSAATPAFSVATYGRVSFSVTPKSSSVALALDVRAATPLASPAVAADQPVAAAALAASISQSQLPTGIVKYLVSDINPGAGGWSSSRGSHISAGKSGGFVANANNTTVHAALWNSMSATIIDLHPSSGAYTSSELFDVYGSQQVGFGFNAAAAKDHALVWSGSASNPVDLNPTGYDSSYAEATIGTKQVGYAFKTGSTTPHAMMWSGSAASFVDLNPTGYGYTYALAANASNQVGYGLTPQLGLHALVWAGSASALDIHPSSGFLDSRATAISGSQVGGYGTDAVTGYNHAIFWTTLATALDLNPAGFKDSQITAMSALGEVGFGRLSTDVNGLTHALLWTGSAATFTDLNQYLPSNYDSAEADGIDANGNVVGVAHDTNTGFLHAVVWVAQVPEPASLAPALGAAMLLVRRRRRA